MITKFIEVSHGGGGNWGKFCVGRWTRDEWAQTSALPEAAGQRLLAGRGWSPQHVWVMDLQTGEGASFLPGGYAKADLDKHRVWVCPMFEPFLAWLYQQDLRDLDALPSYVELPDAPFALSGYRRGFSPGTMREYIEGTEEPMHPDDPRMPTFPDEPDDMGEPGPLGF